MNLYEPTKHNNSPISTNNCPASSFVIDCINASNIKAIRNVETKMQVLDTGTYVFPVSVNTGDEQSDNSYVVSPLTTYTGYAKKELERLNRFWLTWPFTTLINGLSRQLKSAKIDQLVQVNNWLLSTNLYPPDWDGDDLKDMTKMLVKLYPNHAISFRSLNNFSNKDLIKRLRSIGYISIPSRQVYLFDAREGKSSSFLRRHNTKIDANFLCRTPYQVVSGEDICDKDFVRLEALYTNLYINKYCSLNPQFSADWLRCGQRDGWLELSVLQTVEGRIDGVLGWFANKEIITAPIVGYDTTLPQKLGLYRLLTQMCLQKAVERQCILNFSSGASHFKLLRGAQPEIEYSMVYVRHLPASKRRVWDMLSQVLSKVVIPFVKVCKL